MAYPELYKASTQAAIDAIPLPLVGQAIEWFAAARDEKRLIFVCGNGGSAATATHFCCDLLKCSSSAEHGPFRIICLADTVSTLTAYANDVAYDAVFSEPLRHLAQPGDLFLALSGSGNSPNVVKAMEVANSLGLRTIAMTGRDGGRLGALAQLNLHVPVPHMGRIEDAHMVMCHMICYHFVDFEARA